MASTVLYRNRALSPTLMSGPVTCYLSIQFHPKSLVQPFRSPDIIPYVGLWQHVGFSVWDTFSEIWHHWFIHIIQVLVTHLCEETFSNQAS